MIERRPIKLTPHQWAQLERLAAMTDSTATRGPNTGEPSLWAMLRRIAEGEIALWPAPQDNGEQVE